MSTNAPNVTQNRAKRPVEYIELDPAKEYILTNKEAGVGNELTMRLVPHQDGNVSMAVCLGAKLDDPVFTKKLWAKPKEQATQDNNRRLADVFPTAARQKEMVEQGIPAPALPPRKPQPQVQGKDRNGIKKMGGNNERRGGGGSKNVRDY